MKIRLLFASIVVCLIGVLALNKDFRRGAQTRLVLLRGDWYLYRRSPREALATYAEAIELAYQRRPKPDLVSYERAKTSFRQAVDQLRSDPAMKEAFVGEELIAQGEPHWSDPGCGTESKDLGLSPRQLVEEYLRRDYQGDFLRGNSWRGAAVSCPNYGGGSDTIYIVTNYKITSADENRFDVEYESAGSMSRNFEPQAERVTATFVVGRTPWGWKFVQHGAVQKCSPSAALRALKEGGGPIDALSAETLQRLAAQEMSL